MATMVSQITSLTIVHSTVYSDQRKHQSSASLAFVRGKCIHLMTSSSKLHGTAVSRIPLKPRLLHSLGLSLGLCRKVVVKSISTSNKQHIGVSPSAPTLIDIIFVIWLTHTARLFMISVYEFTDLHLNRCIPSFRGLKSNHEYGACCKFLHINFARKCKQNNYMLVDSWQHNWFDIAWGQCSLLNQVARHRRNYVIVR